MNIEIRSIQEKDYLSVYKNTYEKMYKVHKYI